MIDLDSHLAHIQIGDADAFGHWLAGAEGTVRVSLRSFAASVDTEAVLQESLLRVWQVAPRIVPDGRPNALLRFAIRVARNLAVSERRRLRTVAPGDEALDAAAEDASPTPGPPDPLLRRAIVDCRERLPDKPRLALDARLACGGLEADEVLAERLAMRTNTFLQNFTRARRLLAECLEARGVDLAAELR